MRLTNYWWMLVWMFTGGTLLLLYFPKYKENVLGKEEYRWGVSSAILLILPYIIWAGWRPDSIGDTAAYHNAFNTAPDSLGQLPAYLTTIAKDKGFSILTVVIKSIIGDSAIMYFLIIAAIQLLLVVLVLRKYSCDLWLSVFLFIASTDYFAWMYNGMRQFLAATITFAATGFIVRKKYIGSIMLILLAATIHGSALLMLPVIFIVQGKAWNQKTVLCVLASIVALVFIGRFTNLLDSLLVETQYQNVVRDWQEWNDDGTNPIRVLVWSMPAVLSLIGLRQIKEADDALINVCVGYSLLTVALGVVSMGTSGIFLGRLPIYVSLGANLILLPWEIENLFTKDSARIVKIAVIICYVAFFYYSMFL